MLLMHRRSLIRIIAGIALLAILGAGSAQSGNYLSAEESDPAKQGWMKGFPPPPDKLIMQPESDFFSFPKLRWSVCHIRELMPTKQVSRGIASPGPLKYALDDELDSVTFTPIGGKGRMTWKDSLSKNYTDGMLIIHEGKVVYERYFGALEETGKHAAMSMTKSLTGLLAEILVVEGKLDDKAKIESIVPELKGSAFGNATVRQVMDMTTALDYS